MLFRRRIFLALVLLVLTPPLFLRAAVPRRHPVRKSSTTAALLSDPHFDPFRDPTKVKRLDQAPVSEWKAILSEPAAADAEQQYAALQSACGEKGLDADNTLLQSSDAAAASAAGAHPAFVLLAGDLLVHRFDCRYKRLAGDSPEGLEQFAQKTASYVVLQLAGAFPATPVVAAMGNNDSGCGDYNLDANDAFLKNTADAVQQGWHRLRPEDRERARAEYKELGSYSLPMPAPMRRSRVIVLNDIYLSSGFHGCDGKPHPEHGEALLQWLDRTLNTAHEHGEQVWVLTHIPPGVNVYSTFLHGRSVCEGGAPAMFLSSERLAEVLSRYASTVRVVIAGHTHVDEMHLIGIDQSSGTVAIKSVPSISPISGNGPSFLTAKVDPVTATLLDYQLHIADGDKGANLVWRTSYDYAIAYEQPRFNAAAVQQIIQRFGSAKDADAPLVTNYQRHYTTGLKRLALQAVWPAYVCSMQHDTAQGYAACSCKTPEK